MSPTLPIHHAERRAAERVSMHRPARVMLRDGAVTECKTFDISATGVGFVSDVALPTGELCAVNFTIVFADAGSHEVKAVGTIVYCIFSSERHGFKTGVAFHQPAAALLSAVQRCVNEKHQALRDR
jgi:hypothetical protein